MHDCALLLLLASLPRVPCGRSMEIVLLTIAIRTMGVELASGITRLNVELGEIADSGDLDVFGGLDEVRALDRAVGDDARTVAALNTPGDLDALGLANDRIGLRRREDTPVVEGVHYEDHACTLGRNSRAR